MKGIVYFISLYFTFKEDNIIPHPSASNIKGMINTGQNIKYQLNGMLKYIIIPNKTSEAMKKSSIPDNAADAGIANLGKYTFVSKFEFPTRLFPENPTAPEKYIQGTRAE